MTTSTGLDPLRLLSDLLRIASPSGREGAAVAFLCAEATRAGFRASRDAAGNFVAELGEGDTTHVLLGHIDTVPGEIPVRLEAGELWGRGAVDAKGPLAAFLCAAARLGAVPGQRLVVIGAVEEEAASSKGAFYARDRYRPANTVIGEPSGTRGLTLGYKGRLLAELEVVESKAHSSVPRPTPVERLVTAWESIREHASRSSEGKSVFDSLQPSLDAIDTERGAFEVRARARIGFRLPLGCDRDGLKSLLHDAAARAQASLRLEGEIPAFRSPKTTPVARAFLAALREQGEEPVFKVKTGTADMNVVGPLWGPSILAYGPGDSSLDHTPEERLRVDDLLKSIDVVCGALARLTGKR